MKVLFVVAVLVAAVAAQEAESHEQPSGREGSPFPDFHEAPNRPMKLALRSSEEGTAGAGEQIPDEKACNCPGNCWCTSPCCSGVCWC